MTDFLKNNPILSHLGIPLLIVFMFFVLVGKKYSDKQDTLLYDNINKEVNVGIDSVISINKEILMELQNGR